MSTHPLDNPIWSALSSLHAPLARQSGPALRYPREIAPFLGLPTGARVTSDELSTLVDGDEQVFLLGDAPIVPDGWSLSSLGQLLQMTCDTAPAIPDGPEILPLTDARHRQDVLTLTGLVYPHYFRNDTMRLGRYFGIYEHGKLSAMIGERMGATVRGSRGHREISAVCTHPDATGRGLARRLFAWLTQDLIARREQPFLHVSPQNRRAIELYRQNGFTVRTEIAFHALQRR